ncbi:MAG: four helix bundle protein [Ruminococcus sp.]|nr:four helix bundle protein [Ruminococcus sp.]
MSISEEVIKPKTDDLALRIIKLYKVLVNERKEFVLSKHLLRSGTSIGANVTEGQYAISRAEFRSKNSIALKEAVESEYWINLLFKSEYINQKEYDSLMADLKPIIKILISIVKNTGEQQKPDDK